MDNTVINEINEGLEQWKQEDWARMHGFSSYQNYLDEAWGTRYLEPCLSQIIVEFSDNELKEFVKEGTEEEQEAASLEIAVRRCEKAFLQEKEGA